MKNILFALVFSTVAVAATKSYQVTGPVTEITPTGITVQKGKEKFEISRDASTKMGSEIKVGDKVTAYYKMTATEVEVKPAKKGK